MILQSDALVVIDRLKGISFSAELDLIVQDCILFSKSFKSFSFMFIRRNVNEDAHHMVGMGKTHR